MTRRRFIADTFDRAAATATLQEEQAAHLARVLRAAPGQIYDLVVDGFLYRAEIVSVTADPGREPVHFALHEQLETEPTLNLHLLLAVFKFDHLEWAIEKATELGTDRITPVVARRTEKHLALAAEKRVERWRRIALEASKQSRRTTIPTIDAPLKLAQAIDTAAATPTRLLLSEVEQARSLAAALPSPATPVACAVGPEGGWTPEELTLFSAAGWHAVTLGPRILRAETAAIAATAILASSLL